MKKELVIFWALAVFLLFCMFVGAIFKIIELTGKC